MNPDIHLYLNITQTEKYLFSNEIGKVPSKVLEQEEFYFLINSPISHCFPVNPVEQLQLYSLTRSVQVPLFLQGMLAQSLMSILEDKHPQLALPTRLMDLKKTAMVVKLPWMG